MYSDVYAAKQHLTALFDACDQGLLEDVEVWTPRGVVEELVRQFGERATRMRKVIGLVEFDLGAFGAEKTTLPSADEGAVAAYRQHLEGRLTSHCRRIVEHPQTSSRIVDWAAQRRRPIKVADDPQPTKGEPDYTPFQKPKTKPIFGVVDAAIWLTVIEAARGARSVAFITSNTSDFADKADRCRPCEQLSADLSAARQNPTKVQIFARTGDFNERYVKPLATARADAEAFLADGADLETLKSEISDAVEWFPLSLTDDWQFDVEIDNSTLASFDPTAVDLVRADPAAKGLFMTLTVVGTARFDLGIHKSNAISIAEDSPIHVYDWDWNESMVAAEAEVPAQLLVEVLLHDGEIGVSLEDIEPG